MPQNNMPFVVRVIARGRVVDQQWLNVYYYASDTFDDTLDDFLDAFVDLVSPPWQGVTNSGCAWDDVSCEGLKGTINFATRPVNAVGGIGGDALPPFVTWDFTYLRGGVGERNGYKRFAGLSETSQVNGVATTTLVASLTVLASALFDTVDTTADHWQPVIRRTHIDHVLQNPAKFFSISSIVYSKIGSQNSRKFGHGR